MRPGILNWCLAGLQDYLANGIPGAVAVATETDQYVAGQDLFGLFLDECTEQSWEECVFDEFVRAFHGWLEARGENNRLWTGKRITNELKRRGYEKRRGMTARDRNRTFYRGLRLTIPLPQHE
jgi:phage/plasmid-associated DNA primase